MKLIKKRELLYMQIFLNKQWKNGFTLLETVVVIGIVSLISSIVFASFSEYRYRQSRDGAVETVMAAFSRAHLDSIASRDDSVYGVNLKQTEVIYFKGDTYPGDNDAGNTHYNLPSVIEIANISLNGGGTAVFFKKITGATDQYGTLDVRVKSKTAVKSTITVIQTGSTSI